MPDPRAHRAVKQRKAESEKTVANPTISLIARFHAAGWLEMAWFLYQWGDAAEVLKPAGLRDLSENYRRSDFDALP